MTKGEEVFIKFCQKNNIIFENRTDYNLGGPDFKITYGSKNFFLEIKQIDADTNYQVTSSGAIMSRIVGNHGREAINSARKQMQFAARQKTPGILLIYNNLDRLQAFGTEPGDFLAAMFGEFTVSIQVSADRIMRGSNIFHSRNSKMLIKNKANDKIINTSFSAVGHLSDFNGIIRVEIYENPNAKYKIDYVSLPSCIAAKHVVIE